MIDVLKVPSNLRHVLHRGIVVEPEHYRLFGGAAERGIYAGEMANVVIRPARGQFVTPVPSDTFSRRRLSSCRRAATSTTARYTASTATTSVSIQ